MDGAGCWRTVLKRWVEFQRPEISGLSGRGSLASVHQRKESGMAPSRVASRATADGSSKRPAQSASSQPAAKGTKAEDKGAKAEANGSMAAAKGSKAEANGSKAEANGSKAATPTKFEQLKASSTHLREPLGSELSNESKNFSEGAVQILKFHGSYQQDNRDNRRKGEEKDWQMMLRLRSPAGRIPVPLYLALDGLADRLGNGTLRATTRQAFQMHGVAKADLKEVIGTSGPVQRRRVPRRAASCRSDRRSADAGGRRGFLSRPLGGWRPQLPHPSQRGGQARQGPPERGGRVQR